MESEVTAVSTVLKNARKAQGLTIKAIAQDICVQSGYLKAIESGTYDKLPAQTFAVGFVRSYATALGEDSDQIVAAFKEECAFVKHEIAPAKVPQGKPQRKIPGWLSPIAGLTGASLVWMALGTSLGGATIVADAQNNIANEEAQLAALQSNFDAKAVAVALAQSEEAPLHVSAEQAKIEVEEATYSTSSFFLPAAHADTEAPVYDTGSTVLLEASEDSWVRVSRTDGTELWSGILRAGQTYRPQDSEKMLLATSNAGGLTLKQGAEQVASLGGRGEIITDYVLTYKNQASQSELASVGTLNTD